MTTKRTPKGATGKAQRTPDEQAIYELLRTSGDKKPYRAVADTPAGTEFVATVAAYLPKIRAAYARMDETQMRRPAGDLKLKVNPIWTAAHNVARTWNKAGAPEKLLVARQASQFPGWPRQDGDTNAAFVARTDQHIKAFVAPFAGGLVNKLEMDPDKMKSGVLYVGTCEREDMKINLDLDAILYLRGAVVNILQAPAGVTPDGPFVALADGFLDLVDDPGRGVNTYERAKEAVSKGHTQFYFRPNRKVND